LNTLSNMLILMHDTMLREKRGGEEMTIANPIHDQDL
jgi:hypothetical protein